MSERRQQDPGQDSSVLPDGLSGMGKELVREIMDDDVPGLGAEVAYHAVFAIPAMLVVLVTLSGVVDNVFAYDLADRLIQVIDESAPRATQELLRNLVINAVERVDGGTASFGLASSVLVAIWAGSNGVGALIKAFNRAYNATEMRPFHRKKAVSILLTVILGLVVNFAFALWVFGGAIGSWIAREFEMGSTFDWVWNLTRFPIGAAVIVFTLGLLYFYGPTMEQRFRWVLPGAVFSTAVWGVLVLGFSLYLSVASPGSAYGALSSVIVFLFFLYLTALILITGAEFNAVLARRHDRRYRHSMGYADASSETLASGVVSLAGREPVQLTAGTMLVGAATVLGIVAAGLFRGRGS